MAEWYAYPNSTDTERLYEFFGYVSRTTEGLFFPVMLVVIWFVAFIGSYSLNSGRPAAAKSFTFASFIIAIMSIMTSILGFLSPKFMYLSFILVAIGVVWIKLED